jgi:catechol 2,3-dioxygenase-like lactoylglutathione lyase family enzyme
LTAFASPHSFATVSISTTLSINVVYTLLKPHPISKGLIPLILRIHHAQITIPMGAEDKARAFYCNVLGLKELQKPEALAQRSGFWLDLNDLQLHVGTESSVERSATKAHIAYEVGDLDDARSRLQREGIEILPGIPIPGYNRFEFRDPFGNRVEFLQRVPIIE